jgi:hypothetical protein
MSSQSTEQNTRSSLTNVGEEPNTELDHVNLLLTNDTSLIEVIDEPAKSAHHCHVQIGIVLVFVLVDKVEVISN